MTEIAIGTAVEERYKALGLTQETLAWVAGVSSSTIRNILANRPGRTWIRVERALGWDARSMERLRAGKPPVELLSADALRVLYAVVMRLAEERDPRAMDVLDFYGDFMRYTRNPIEGHLLKLQIVINKHWPLIRSQISPAEAQPLVDAIARFDGRDPQEWGIGETSLRPSRQAGSGDDGGPVPERLERVPGEVADLLAEGVLLDYAVVPSENSAMKFAVLAVRRGEPAMGDSARSAAVIDAVKHAVNGDEMDAREAVNAVKRLTEYLEQSAAESDGGD